MMAISNLPQIGSDLSQGQSSIWLSEDKDFRLAGVESADGIAFELRNLESHVLYHVILVVTRKSLKIIMALRSRHW